MVNSKIVWGDPIAHDHITLRGPHISQGPRPRTHLSLLSSRHALTTSSQSSSLSLSSPPPPCHCYPPRPCCRVAVAVACRGILPTCCSLPSRLLPTTTRQPFTDRRRSQLSHATAGTLNQNNDNTLLTTHSLNFSTLS